MADDTIVSSVLYPFIKIETKIIRISFISLSIDFPDNIAIKHTLKYMAGIVASLVKSLSH